METIEKIICMMGIAFAVLIGFFVGRQFPKGGEIEPLKEKVDTLYIRDTITSIEPIYVTRRVVDSIRIPVVDTLRMTDTLYVVLEREQIRWEDSLSVVYASGIRPQVDSVVHYTERMVVTKEIPVIQLKRTRWGIGVNAGYGIGKDGLTPWVGVGVSYNILSW